MWGKHFSSMYEGSMYGAGPTFFAIMGYILSNTRNSRLEINPKKLADTLGTTEEDIRSVLGKMTAPDPGSRNKEHEGRRLIKEGEYQYFVTGWAKYQAIRNEDERRESNRIYKQRERERKKPGTKKAQATPSGNGNNHPPISPEPAPQTAGERVYHQIDTQDKNAKFEQLNNQADEEAQEKVDF